VLGHELAHVVQSRLHPVSGVGRMSRPEDASEREATAAALAALAGRTAQLREGVSDDPQALAWWVLALIGLGVGAAVAGAAAATGHGVDENRENEVREQRGTVQDVLAWVPIAGSIQDIWQAESELQLALGVGFLAVDCVSLGGSRMMVRALMQMRGAKARVLEQAGETAGRRIATAGGEEVTEQAAGEAAREFAARGGTVAAGAAQAEIGQALARDGAMVFATEGGHAVLYANNAGQIFKVHGGPLMVRFRIADLGKDAAAVAERAVTGGTGLEGAVTAYATVAEGAPVTLAALERLPGGVLGLTEGVGRAIFGNPTSCGIPQGAGMEASGLTAEALSRLIPSGGASGRFLPITLVDHWLETGAGKLVEGGTAQLIYGATGTVTQATLAIGLVMGRPVAAAGARNVAEGASAPETPEP
jgi:hypothetical protein